MDCEIRWLCTKNVYLMHHLLTSMIIFFVGQLEKKTKKTTFMANFRRFYSENCFILLDIFFIKRVNQTF